MRIIFAKDYDGVSRRAADIIAAKVLLKPDAVLGLATGSSPVGAYKELARGYEEGRLDFSRCRTVNLDEYCGLTPESDQSYARFMRANLFDHINVPRENTNIPDGTNPDADAECARYDGVIASLGGTDIQLLGIGRNGHVAFNEPADQFIPRTHRVALTEDTIAANARFFTNPELVPRFAYTMGMGGIMGSRTALLVAEGEGKAPALWESFFGPVTPRVPASLLQFHKDLIVVADEAALSLILKNRPEAVIR